MKRSKFTKRILAVVLSLSMVMSNVTVTAAEIDNTDSTISTVVETVADSDELGTEDIEEIVEELLEDVDKEESEEIKVASKTVALEEEEVAKTDEITSLETNEASDSEVEEGTIDFSVESNMTELAGCEVSGFNFNGGHGIQSQSNSSAITLNLKSNARLTVTACCYGVGPDGTVNASSGVVSSSIIMEGGEKEAPVFTVKNANGKTTLTFAGNMYIHSIKVEYVEEEVIPTKTTVDEGIINFTVESNMTGVTGCEVTGFNYHGASHGIHSQSASASITLKLESNAKLTVTTCCYGAGANGEVTVSNGKVSSEKVSEGGNEASVYTVVNANEETTLTFPSDMYVHSIKVEYVEKVEEPSDDVDTPEVDKSKEFTLWFNPDGATSIEAGQQGEYPVYAGEKMAAKTNKISVNGTEFYSVQGSTNPKAGADNPNGKIPTIGAYLKVVAPADGTITVYGYPASGKPFYATKGDTAALTDGNAFCDDIHSYTVSVKENEEWYFYAQGSKAQFVGVEFKLPKPSVSIPLNFTGESLGDAKIIFTNIATKDEVVIDKNATKVKLVTESKYSVAIDSATLVIDLEEVDLTNGTPKQITINVEVAKKHAVSGTFKGLPEGAKVSKLVFTDANGVATEASVKGLAYTVELKNANYTTSAELTDAEGYTVFDHVAVSGTEGEDISNDVWFYGPAAVYSTEYKETLKVGKAAGCDYETITEAIAAAKAMTRTTSQYVTIVLTDAEYVEQVIVDTANIKLVADKNVNPIIRWYYGIGYKYYSIDSTGFYNIKNANDKYEMKYAQRWGTTVRVTANGFIAEGINFLNTFNRYVCEEEIGDSVVGNATEYGQSISGSLEERVIGLDVANVTNVERAAAMAVDADNAEFYKCSFVSSQDTLYTGSAHSYYNDCEIVGQTDYIFGNTGCSAVFDNCELRWLGYTAGLKEGYVTATRGAYIFRDCTIKNSNEADHKVKAGYFGRPWGNTASVAFINTEIEEGAICSDGWYDMSGVYPKDVAFAEYGNTSNGYAFLTKYSKDTATYKIGLSLEEAGKLYNDAKKTYLGTFEPVHYENKELTGYVAPDEPVVDPVDPSTGSAKTYTLEAKDLNAVAEGGKADKDAEKAGTDNYFTILYSAKTKIDSSNKTFDDGYSSAQRINFSGKATTEMNSVKITTENPATVKIWWAQAGDDNRQMGILGSDGSVVVSTNDTVAKNAVAISTLELEEAGTYYIGGITNKNFIFKIEVNEVPQAVINEYVFESKNLTAFAAETKADGDSEKAGTDNYFTIIYSAKSKVDSSNKTFDDGYSSGQRVNFGGVAATTMNAIKFTTEGTSEVTVWWAEGGDDNRQIVILDSTGKEVTRTNVTLAKNAVAVSKLTLDKPGTYYLGSVINNNYIFKVKVVDTVGGTVVKPARADWKTVADPTITATVNTDGTIIAKVEMVVGYDGADKVVVSMLDKNGNVVATRTSIAEKNIHELEFNPAASGDYTFEVVAIREGEEDKKGESYKAKDFILPLVAPGLKSATNKGNGTVEVEWDAVAEATSYIVTVDGEEYKETKDLKFTVKDLTVGQEYTFGVKAVREDKLLFVTLDKEVTEIGSTIKLVVKDEAQRTWAFSAYGSSVDTKNNGYEGNVNDGSVTVYSLSGKGKVVPGSTDGLAFYYTEINPETENFTLTADVYVDEWTLSNGQEGFGLMVADTVGKNGDGTAFWNNSYQLLASKIEWTDDVAGKITMKLGLGVTAKLGVTKEDVAAIKAGNITMPGAFTTETVTVENSAVSNGSGTYNLFGNYKGVEPTGNLANLLTKVKLQIQRDNTGYTLRYLDENGEVIGEKLYYDIEREELTKIDADRICLGFFASRNAKITVSNVELTTIDPKDDAPVKEREIEYVTPNYVIESASVANSEDYTLVFYGNADGVLNISDNNGTVVAENVEVKANKKAYFETKLAGEKTTYTVVMTPDENYVPGEFKKLSDYETKTFTHEVTYKKFAGEYIYVSANGKSSNTGASNSPVDIYSAVKYVAAGQTIVLAAERYNLHSTVKVERGINGTSDSPIRMISDPNSSERAVLDFGKRCAGMILAGDYWYFKGFDVTKSADAQKGIQVSGNNNTLDQVNAYMNGNTGIQISRLNGTDEFDQWPANNLILNCTSYLNADKGYEDADGFAAKLTVGNGNVFDGCIAAYNADDGWDLFAKVQSGSIGAVTIQNCLTFKNGYVLTVDGKRYSEITIDGIETDAGNGNGFKMGGDSMPGAHVLKNSIAFANKAKGFDSNSCPDIKVYNSTSFDNESYNVAFYTNTAVNTAYFADGVLSYKVSNGVGETLKLKGTQNESDVYGDTNFYTNDKKNSENKSGVKVDETWFKSLTLDKSVGFYGITRNADGTINMNGFLELTDAAPAGVGARMSGSASNDYTAPEFTAPVETEESNNASNETSNSTSSSSSNQTETTTASVSTSNAAYIAANVDIEKVNGIDTITTVISKDFILRMKTYELYHSQMVNVMVNMPGLVGVSFMTNEAPIGAKDINLTYTKSTEEGFAAGFDTYKYTFKYPTALQFRFTFHMNVGTDYIGKPAYIFVYNTKTKQYEIKSTMFVNEIGNVAVSLDELSRVMVLIAE